jgi:uncharacterized repeat protein (TIGR02543 family)
LIDSDNTIVPAMNQEYIMKMNVETLPNDDIRYRFKVWKSSQPEPNSWTMEGVVSDEDAFAGGSAALVAHHVDVSFGNITVEPLNATRYSLDVSTSGNGAIMQSPNKLDYGDGEDVTLTAVPADGWRFTGWGGDLAGTNNPFVLNVDQDYEVVANFEQVFDLSTSTIGQGSITINPNAAGGEYNAGQSVTLTAVPVEGWVFVGWGGDLSGATNPYNLTMNQDYSITAEFKREFTLTTNAVGPGSVTVNPTSSGGVYIDGTQVTLTAVASKGWKFESWSGISGTTKSVVVTITGNTTATATFVENPDGPEDEAYIIYFPIIENNN